MKHVLAALALTLASFTVHGREDVVYGNYQTTENAAHILFNAEAFASDARHCEDTLARHGPRSSLTYAVCVVMEENLTRQTPEEAVVVRDKEGFRAYLRKHTGSDQKFALYIDSLQYAMSVVDKWTTAEAQTVAGR